MLAGSLTVGAQNVTFNEKEVSLKQAFEKIELVSKYKIAYNESQLDVSKIVALKNKQTDVLNLLDELLKGTGCTYNVKGNYIVITPLQKGTIKKVEGLVKDASGEPVIGATVMVKGTTNGTITDLDGKFVLEASSNAPLEVSYIGYKTQQLVATPGKELCVILKEDTEVLDEVVVVGYGVMKKSDVTGSVAVAKGSDIMKSQSFSALDGLKGKASGVNIFSNSGQPGGNSRVIIRGVGTINSSTEPLYVVDGVVMEDFQHVNPNDIESIEVLKDASSAAIYGARGANGVIMVTTKRGKKGEGVTVSYDGSVSVNTMAKYIDVMNSSEWMEAFQIGLQNANKWYDKDFSLDMTDYFKDPRLFRDGKPLYDTDWQREATHTSVSHNHQLSIQQGGKKSSVGAFINYTDQEGLMLNTYMKRLNAKIAYDSHPTDWLSTAVNLLVNHSWGNRTEEQGGSQEPRRSMIEMVPWMPVTFPDGSWSNSTTVSDKLGLEGMANPVHVLKTKKDHVYRTQIFGNAALTFHLLPGLDLKTQFGVDAHFNKNSLYAPNDLINISYPKGKASIEHTNTLYWQEETYLNYNKVLGSHRLNAMAGLSWQQRTLNSDRMMTEGFSDNSFGYDNMGAGTFPKSPTSRYEQWAMNSYFLRAAYTYSDRYMATVTARVDGSSKFGENNKYAFFPSVGLGWLISNEKFMQNCSAINMLKLHTSYGVTGNSEIGIYRSLSTVSSGSVLVGGNRVPSSWYSRLPNPDLKWERTNQFDFGFNLNLFKNRLNFDVSYYYKKTNDLLLDRPVPHSTGYATVVDNIGSISNQGLDFMVNTVNIQHDNFRWTSTLNVNYNKNKIEKLGENNEDIYPGPNWMKGSQTILRVGESVASFYGYDRIGIWGEDEREAALAAGANVGQAKRSAEKRILGKGLPDVTGSFINTFQYKNWDFTMDLQFVAGVDVLQRTIHASEDRFGLSNGLSSVLYEAWSPSNTNTSVQAIRLANMGMGQNSDLDSRWVANGSYLRGNLFQLGYTFDQSWLKKMSLSSLRLYFNVNNAFVVTSKDFKGYDPEGTTHGNAQWGQNIMFYQHPKPRTYTLGVNLAF